MSEMSWFLRQCLPMSALANPYRCVAPKARDTGSQRFVPVGKGCLQAILSGKGMTECGAWRLHVDACPIELPKTTDWHGSATCWHAPRGSTAAWEAGGSALPSMRFPTGHAASACVVWPSHGARVFGAHSSPAWRVCDGTTQKRMCQHS